MVNVWRNSIRNLKAEQVAAFGEVINGRRKIKPITGIDKKVENIPYELNKPVTLEGEEALGNHLVKQPVSPRKKKAEATTTPRIVDTNFGDKLAKNNNSK